CAAFAMQRSSQAGPLTVSPPNVAAARTGNETRTSRPLRSSSHGRPRP
ncbi:hypothetical protein CF327_g4074, partial [Tilletia walkeri]